MLVRVMSPGNMACTRPAAHIAAMICAGTRKRARTGGSVPAMTIPKVTCHDSILSVLCGKSVMVGRLVTYCWVEQPTTNTIKCPHIHQQTQSVYERDKNHCLAAWSAIEYRRITSLGIEHDLARESKEQEHECSHELAGRSNKVCCHGANMGRFMSTTVAVSMLLVVVVFGFAMDWNSWHRDKSCSSDGGRGFVAQQ